jgi:hypothetical protein
MYGPGTVLQAQRVQIDALCSARDAMDGQHRLMVGGRTSAPHNDTGRVLPPSFTTVFSAAVCKTIVGTLVTELVPRTHACNVLLSRKAISAAPCSEATLCTVAGMQPQAQHPGQSPQVGQCGCYAEWPSLWPA